MVFLTHYFPPLKGIENLHPVGRRQANTIVMEKFKNIVFHKFNYLLSSSIFINQSIPYKFVPQFQTAYLTANLP
jgi:hypothetical protein